MADYDLIIVGGGPAGAAAALYAQRHALRALLVDKAHFPRDKVCGDAVSGKSVAMLAELGLLEEVRALPGAPVGHIVFASPDHTEANIPLDRYPLTDLMTGRTLPMEGFVIRREVFDDFLFRYRQNADFRTHDHEIVVGDDVEITVQSRRLIGAHPSYLLKLLRRNTHEVG